MARKSRVRTLIEREQAAESIYLAGQYTRLSVEDGDDVETNSIGNQAKIGRHFLSEHSAITLIETYVDNGYTGMNFNRPGFLQMMADLRAGKINCVIVKDISRLGRHFVFTSEFVERIFPKMGVRLICINDDYDSNDESANASALTLPLKMVMNDYYAKDISRKIRSSIYAKIDCGEYLPAAGSIPYGYLRNPEKTTYDIDPEAAQQVLRIFEMRADGMKFNAIAKALNAEGIPCPGKLRYLRGITKAAKYENAQWIRGTIRKITNDVTYIGHRVHGRVKRDKIGLEKKQRSPEEWSIIENAHCPIVPKELFERVKQVNEAELNHRSQFEKRSEPEVDFRALFHGKLFCAHCGSMMAAGKGCTRTIDKPSRIFFDCKAYKYSNHSLCSSHYVRQEVIMERVTNLLEQQVKIAGDIERLAQSIQRVPKVMSFQHNAEQQLLSIVTRKRNIEAKIEHLLEDLADRVIDRDQYLYMKKVYSRQLEVLCEEEAHAHSDTQALDRALNSTKTWVAAVRKYSVLPELNREILDLLVESILVYDHTHIKINLKYSDPYLAINTFLKEVEVMEHAG